MLASVPDGFDECTAERIPVYRASRDYGLSVGSGNYPGAKRVSVSNEV